MNKYKESENGLGKILAGLLMGIIFGLLTWYQIGRISQESYWVIFRIWFIPVPAILITGAGTIGGFILLSQGIVSKCRTLFNR